MVRPPMMGGFFTPPPPFQRPVMPNFNIPIWRPTPNPFQRFLAPHFDGRQFNNSGRLGGAMGWNPSHNIMNLASILNRPRPVTPWSQALG